MIKAILVFNNHGKPRLSKFYQYFVSITIISICYYKPVKFNKLFFFSSEWGHATTDNKRNISISFKERR